MDLGNGTYRTAVETTTPSPWERYFRAKNASVIRRDIDVDALQERGPRLPDDGRRGGRGAGAGERC